RQSLLEEQQDEWMSMIAAFNDDAKKIESKVSVQITPKKTKVDASTQTERGIFKPKKKSISTQTDSEDKKHKKHVHVSEKGGESDTGSQKGSRRKPSYVPSGPLGEPYPNLEPYMKQLLQALVELGITRVTDADIERVYEKTKIEPLRNLHVSYVQGYLQGLIFAPKMYKPLSVLQVEQLLKLLHEASQHRHNKIRQLLQLLREVSNNKQASITKMLQLLRRVNILRNAQLQPSRSMLSGASRARAFEPGYAVAANPATYASQAISQSAQQKLDAQSHIDMTIERARLERTHQSIAQQSFDKPQPLPTILYNQPLPDMSPSGSSSQLVAAPKPRQIARSLVQGLKK
ncbi:hypothetical protein KBD08_02135, partial [Candidatus Babeliales bacterium]|nr:hypothetical protein [Candidatus Babeliales bacterium]